jgi:hypothetical protein
MISTETAKENQISTFIQKLGAWLLYVIFLIFVAEIAAGFALDLYRKSRVDSTDFSVMSKDLSKELAHVQGRANLSLYRWYQNLPNFNGMYVITDPSGFRIDQRALDNRVQIGMYGGSTTFSVLTDQKNTIADQLSQKNDIYQLLNFGIGGYSTSAEIMTLVESLRIYPNIKIAIFYDGVNELGRAIEGQIKNLNGNESEFILGTPYIDGVQAAIRNSTGPGFSLNQSNLFYIYDRILARKRMNDSLSYDLLQSVKERYFANLKILSAICNEYELKCIFIVQPSIHTTHDSVLTDSEIRIKKNDIFGKNYPQLINEIFSDDRANKFNIIDLSTALNSKENTLRVFYDWHHLNSEGNKIIANQIKSEIMPALNSD